MARLVVYAFVDTVGDCVRSLGGYGRVVREVVPTTVRPAVPVDLGPVLQDTVVSTVAGRWPPTPSRQKFWTRAGALPSGPSGRVTAGIPWMHPIWEFPSWGCSCATTPRIPQNVDAIERELTDGPLVWRYLPDETDDGLGGQPKGSFTLPGLWLIRTLSPQTVFLFRQLGSHGLAKISNFEEGPNLNFAVAGHRVGPAFDPLNRLGHVFDFPYPDPCYKI